MMDYFKSIVLKGLKINEFEKFIKTIIDIDPVVVMQIEKHSATIIAYDRDKKLIKKSVCKDLKYFCVGEFSNSIFGGKIKIVFSNIKKTLLILLTGNKSHPENNILKLIVDPKTNQCVKCLFSSDFSSEREVTLENRPEGSEGVIYEIPITVNFPHNLYKYPEVNNAIYDAEHYIKYPYLPISKNDLRQYLIKTYNIKKIPFSLMSKTYGIIDDPEVPNIYIKNVSGNGILYNITILPRHVYKESRRGRKKSSTP